MKISNLENDIKNLKLLLNESNANSTKYQNEKELLANNVREKTFENVRLMTKNHNSNLKIMMLEDKIVEIRNTRKDVHYFEFYDTLAFSLKELFECPLSMAELTSPMILLSGNTIQEDYCDELIKRNSLDPFNKNLRVQHKIVNRFVLDVKEVLDKSQQKVATEVDKRREAEQAKIRAQQNSKSVEIQADILVRSEDDIALIDHLKKKLNSNLYKDK